METCRNGLGTVIDKKATKSSHSPIQTFRTHIYHRYEHCHISVLSIFYTSTVTQMKKRDLGICGVFPHELGLEKTSALMHGQSKLYLQTLCPPGVEGRQRKQRGWNSCTFLYSWQASPSSECWKNAHKSLTNCNQLKKAVKAYLWFQHG